MKSLFDLLLKPEYRIKNSQEWFPVNFSDSRKNERNAEITKYYLSQEFTQDVGLIRTGQFRFRPPLMSRICQENGKTRSIYHYEGKERMLLCIIAKVLGKFCDDIFSPCLYSYRKNISRLGAFRAIKRMPEMNHLHSYRLDVSGYDRSILGDPLRNLIRKRIADSEMAQFLCNFTEQREYIFNGVVYNDAPTVKTGCPLTPFFNNLYLSDYDDAVIGKCRLYCRFGDDILICGTTEQIDDCVRYTNEIFAEKGLVINKNKSGIYAPREKFEFLGCDIRGNTIDFSDNAVAIVRRVMKKKVLSFLKIKKKYSLTDELAMCLAVSCVRSIYDLIRSLFGQINQSDAIREIDHIMQNAIRTVGTGKFNNGKYRVSYKQLRELGYEPLVSIYYRWDWSSKA